MMILEWQSDTLIMQQECGMTLTGLKTHDYPFGSLFTKSSGPSIWMKNNSFVMGTAPATNRYTGLWIKDTNDNDVAYIVHQANKNNSQNIRLLVSNTDGVNIYQTALTFQSTINGEFNFYPDADNVVNLGKSTNKWTNVYATNFTGDLVGNATSATKATQDASGNVITDTYATKLYVDNEISGIVNSAPATLDTLNELASALGDDPNFATTIATQIGTKANDSDVVHTSGNETIDGNKFFSKTIRRTADITTSAAEEVYKFTDTNATPCGSIYNRMYWVSNKVFNRHHAYNATSGKDMYVEVVSDNDGSGVINTGGSVTDNRNLTTVTAGTGSTYVATMGWVNNPETSTNVVHRSGDETIVGTKTFSSNIVGNISGSSTSCTGNSVSATKLATGRTINIQDADGTNTGTAVTFNGTTNGVIKLPATIKATITGNASTATQFSANKSVTLTGDVTGTASSNAGWSVATTLANSGATAGTYGPTADVTGNNNATIVVPQITVDAKGRVTAVTTKTLTCKNNTYTVNDATLTIQKNGTTVKTFTANASSNVTANITVPTKVSELTNDSGYITGVSWDNVSGKPSTFTPKTHTHDDRYYTESEINTKLGIKANDANVVHLTGDESIANKKYFDSTNNSSSCIKRITDYATEDTPTRNVYQHLAFQDKNNKNLALVQYASRSSNVRDLDLYVFDASGSGYGIKIGTNKEVTPIANNEYSLGSTSNKWLSVCATNFYGDYGSFSNKVEAPLVRATADLGLVLANKDSKAPTTTSGWNQLQFYDKNMVQLGYFQLSSNTNANVYNWVGRKNANLTDWRNIFWNVDVGVFGCDPPNTVSLGSSSNKWAQLHCTEITTYGSNFLRSIYGDYGTFCRNDGNNLYLMVTAKGDQTGDFTTARPIRVSLSDRKSVV